MLILICLIIVGFIIWNFKKDSKEVQHRILAYGGIKKLFPEFVGYFEENGFELVEDSGSNLVYKKALTDNYPYNKYLFLGIESKFTNVAYGYVISVNGKKTNGMNVEFPKNFRADEVEMIIRKITGNMMLQRVI